MYQNIFFSRSNQLVHIWDDENGYYTFPYEPYAYVIDPKGEYKTMSGLKVKKVKQWNKDLEKKGLVFEHDVRPETRVLIDNYFESDEPSKNHRILFLDIEVLKGQKYSKPNEALNVINAISYYVSTEGKYHCLLLDTDFNLENKVIDGVEIRRFNTENDLLTYFLNQYQKINPTILTGWNTDQFDMPYLYHRIINVLGDKWSKKLSPIGIVYTQERGREYTVKIAGVSQMDYLQLYKNYTYNEEPRYTLDAIAKKELKRGKVEYEGSLDKLFQEDIHKFIQYNVSDVELIVAMDKKLDFIEIARGICHKGHVPYEDFSMSSRYLDGALLTDCKRNGIIAAGTVKDENTNNDSAEGAFVKLPKPGIYSFVYDLDLESEYPNNIKSINISPETKFGRMFDFDIKDFVSKKDTKYHGEKILLKTFTDNWDFDDNSKFSFNSYVDFLNFLNENNLSISSAGILYSLDQKGLIPTILTKWGEERSKFRKIAKDFHNQGDLDKYKYYDRKQLVQKILLNSLYGVLLLPSFRFYDKENGESVTLSGQTLVQFSSDIGNLYYNKQIQNDSYIDYCIYQDTDSAFFEAFPMIEHRYGKGPFTEEFLVEKTLEIAKEMEDHINKSYSVYALRYHNLKEHTWKIKQEMVGKSAFWRDKKKRYAMWIINKNGLPCDELEVKGFDAVRSDFPKDFRTFQSKCIEDILRGKDSNQMNEIMRLEKDKIIKEAKLNDILLPTGVKEISKFRYGQKGTPAHVKSAQNYNKLLELFKLESFPKIDDGDKILWSYLKPNPYGFETLAIRGYEDPEDILEFLNKYSDRKMIFENRLLNKMQSIWDNLGWGQIDLNDHENNFF